MFHLIHVKSFANSCCQSNFQTKKNSVLSISVKIHVFNKWTKWDSHSHSEEPVHKVECAKEKVLPLKDTESDDMDITQMVDKYDKTFFKGELKNKVDYRWSTFSEGWRETAGVAFPKIKYPKIWIELNRRIAKNKRGALHRVRSTLVHEMIHAYCMLKKLMTTPWPQI